MFWISLQEAERHFEVTRASLVRAVRAGKLQTRRILVENDLVVAVSSAELERDYSPRRALAAADEKPEVPLADVALRVELEAERIQRARLEGELAASDKIERSLQRYADRLEVELAEARKQAMTLARALGRAERLAGEQAARLEAPRRKSSWWAFWR